MDVRKSQEKSSVKVKKIPPLRRGKVSPHLSVPEHIPRPSYVGSNRPQELSAVRQVHNAEGIAGMRAACKLAARVLDFAGTLVKPSVTTNEINRAVHNMIVENGDIINIDVNVFLNGYHGETSRPFVCGEVDESIKHFLKAAEECLEKGISVCRDGVNYRKIGKKIRTYTYNGKNSVLHGKMDGLLSPLMAAGLHSSSIPYWSLGQAQKYRQKFEFILVDYSKKLLNHLLSDGS